MEGVTKAIIPVAGLGTRFLPATKAQPKEMLPLVDKPVIQHVVEEAIQAGIQTIVFVTGRGKQAIENHFDVAYELEHTLLTRGKTDELLRVQNPGQDVSFAYLRQGQALGLGHAIRCAEPIAGKEPVAVLLGDDVFHGPGPALAPLLHAYATHGVSVVGVQEVPEEHLHRYGVVSDRPQSGDSCWTVGAIVEKPEPQEAPSRFAVVGRYVLSPEAFDRLAHIRPGHGGEYQLTDALSELAQEGRLVAAIIPHQRYDTGNKLDYIKANIDFALRRTEFKEELIEFLEDKLKRNQTDPIEFNDLENL